MWKTPALSLLFAFTALAPALHAATIITPVSATSATGNLSNRPIEETITGNGLSSSGLSGDILSETHNVNSANSGEYWIGPVSGAALTFVLGGTYAVDTVHLWTYSRTGETDRGMASFDISFSTDGGVSFNALPTIPIAGIAIGDFPNPIKVQSFSFARQSGVTDIRLDNIVNYGDANYTGLSEIRFGDVAIPEPASLALLGLGGLFFIRRRKWQRESVL